MGFVLLKSKEKVANKNNVRAAHNIIKLNFVQILQPHVPF